MKVDGQQGTLISKGDASAEPRTIDTGEYDRSPSADVYGGALAAGEIVSGRFQIKELVQSGGMGDVYRAEDLTTGGSVAVKTWRAGGASPERFAREARRLAELTHPGIPRYIAHDLTSSAVPYLVMEWLEGVELSTYLRAARLGIRSSVELIATTARAVWAAHDRGIVHRDLHPNNMFLVGGDPRDVRVLDFGIARLETGDAPLTAEGAQIGTPGYMAPEQVEGRGAVGPAADVFSLGCVLFECLTGQRPFYAPTIRELLARTLADHPPPPSELHEGVPPELDHLVARMLEKDPARRPRDAAEVLELISALPPLADAPLQEEEPQAPVSTEQQVTSLIVLRAETPGSFERCVLAAEPHGMRVRRSTDDTIVIATYGTGTAADHASRAARCALAVQRATRTTRMAMSTGLSQQVGEALSGRAFDSALVSLLLKDELLEPGGQNGASLWLDENTASLLDSRFDVRSVEHGFLLRGLRDTYEPSRTVLGKRTRCVGRKRELSMLEATLAESFEDSVASSVLVTGPPGIGKSRLGNELTRLARRQIAGVQVIRGGAEAMTAGAPFGALSKALSRVCRIRETEPDSTRRTKLEEHLRPLVPEEDFRRIVEFLQELLGIHTTHQLSPQMEAARRDAVLRGDQIQRAVEDWLKGECRHHPVLIILDDFHWGDLPTVRLMDSVLRNLAEQRLVVLVMARPEVHELFPKMWVKRGVTELRLSGLSRRAATEMIHEVLGDRIRKEVLERVITRGQGNPFWLEELLRAEHAGKGENAPDRVVLLAQSRIEQQTAEERRLLKAASVFGRQFWSGGAGAVLGTASTGKRTESILRDLQDGEFIVERELSRLGGAVEYEFASGLLRDAAYSLLDEDEKEQGHLRAAEWLERNGDADPLAVAMHFTLGGEADRARAHYLRAAEQALSGDDLDAALSCAEEGLSAGARGLDAVRLRLVHAEANKWRGDNAAAFRSAQAAFARAEEGSAEWYRAAAEAAVAAGKSGKRESSLAIAKELLESRPSKNASVERGIALSRVATQLILSGDITMGRGLVDVVSDGDTRLEPDPQMLGFFNEAKAVLAGASQDPVGRIKYAEAAVAHFEDAGDLRNACLARLSQGFAEVEFGANSDAQLTLRQALQVAENMGLSNSVPVAKAQLGRARVRLGEVEEGLLLLESATDAFDRQKNLRLAGMTRLYQAEAQLCLSHVDSALDCCQRAAGILNKIPPMLRVAQSLMAVIVARSASEQSDLQEAQALAELSLEGLNSASRLPVSETLVRLCAGQALILTGKKNEGDSILLDEVKRVTDLAQKMSAQRAAQFLEGCPARACLALWERGASEPSKTLLKTGDYPAFLRAQAEEERDTVVPESHEASTLLEVERIVREQHPVLRNLWITESYHRLSGEIASVVDRQNANWSTFACWASKSAGESIRNEEVPEFLRKELALTGGSLPKISSPIDALLGALGLANLVRRAAVFTLKEVSEKVALGNLAVYAELAPLFARFVDLMRKNPSDEQFDEFITTLSSGPIEKGGQELLKRAFLSWYEASRSGTESHRAQLILRANCQIGFHEQSRLQPHIQGAMNAPIDVLFRKKLRKLLPIFLGAPGAWLLSVLARGFVSEVTRRWEMIATRYAMRLSLPGGKEIPLGEDLPNRPDTFPPDLRKLDDPKTAALLEQFDQQLSGTVASGANNWADLKDRMGFIVELFRSRQQDLGLFEPPFDEKQLATLAQGRVPEGRL